jgi:small Trp-rich protein
MAMVIVGLLLLAMKVFDFGFAADWHWGWILLPFGLALAWWQYADSSGLTRKREMDKDDARKADRRKRNVEALGLGAKLPGGRRNRRDN